MPVLRRTMSGKNNGACHLVMKREGQLATLTGPSAEGWTTTPPTSGSRPTSLGCAWWALCLGTHQPKLMPISTLPTARPSQRFARLELKTSWWPASCPTKPSWVKASPRNPAMARAHQELPINTSAVKPAAKAAIVTGIMRA